MKSSISFSSEKIPFIIGYLFFKESYFLEDDDNIHTLSINFSFIISIILSIFVPLIIKLNVLFVSFLFNSSITNFIDNSFSTKINAPNVLFLNESIISNDSFTFSFRESL